MKSKQSKKQYPRRLSRGGYWNLEKKLINEKRQQMEDKDSMSCDSCPSLPS